MVESFLKNGKGIALVALSAFFVCFGQFFWKVSQGNADAYLAIGFLLYGIGALVLLIAYRHGSLSVLQPLLSLSYIMSIAVGKYLLDESVSINEWLGVLIIIMGVIFIGGGDD